MKSKFAVVVAPSDGEDEDTGEVDSWHDSLAAAVNAAKQTISEDQDHHEDVDS